MSLHEEGQLSLEEELPNDEAVGMVPSPHLLAPSHTGHLSDPRLFRTHTERESVPLRAPCGAVGEE